MHQRPLAAPLPRNPVLGGRPSSPMVRDIGRDAMNLLVEARNYFTARRDSVTVNTYYRMVVTNRLIWVMAWVLYQKAVESGEISEADAMAAMDDMMENKGEPDHCENIPGDLPPALLSLVYRSGTLRERVARLVLGARTVRRFRRRAGLSRIS